MHGLMREEFTVGDIRVQLTQMPDQVARLNSRKRKREHVALDPELRRRIWAAILEAIEAIVRGLRPVQAAGPGGKHETPPNDDQGGEKLVSVNGTAKKK